MVDRSQLTWYWWLTGPVTHLARDHITSTNTSAFSAEEDEGEDECDDDLLWLC